MIEARLTPEQLKWRVSECHEKAKAEQKTPQLDLTGIDLQGMDLRGIDFENIDITLDPACRFVGTVVDQKVLEALLPAIRKAKISLQEVCVASALKGEIRENSQLGGEIVTHYVPLQGLNFTKAKFDSLHLVNLTDAIVSECDLAYRKLLTCLVSGLNVKGAKLEGAQFTAYQAATLVNYDPAQNAHIHAAKNKPLSTWVQFGRALIALCFEKDSAVQGAADTVNKSAVKKHAMSLENPYQVPEGMAAESGRLSPSPRHTQRVLLSSRPSRSA